MLQKLRTRADLHWARKIFHITSILAILSCMVFLPRELCWKLYLILGIPLVILDFLRPHLPKFNRIALKLIGPVIRKHEVRKASGSSYAILGIGLAYLFLPTLMAQLGVLCLAVGDPTASLFGLLWGRGKFWGNKSLAGYLSGGFFCTLSSYLFLSLTNPPLITGHSLLAISLACGFVGATAELVQLFNLDDNLTQPLITGSWLSILSVIFLGGVA